MGKDLDCIWFCRHGQTVSNLEGWLAGSLDTPLTELGRYQAQMAAETLRGRQIERIFASPLSRAKETAQIIAEHLGVAVVTMPALAERYWGELEGRAFPADLRRETVPGGEDLICFYRRVALAMDQVLAREGGGLPLVVAHAGTGQAIQHYYGLSPDEGMAANAQPYKIFRQSAR